MYSNISSQFSLLSLVNMIRKVKQLEKSCTITFLQVVEKGPERILLSAQSFFFKKLTTIRYDDTFLRSIYLQKSGFLGNGLLGAKTSLDSSLSSKFIFLFFSKFLIATFGKSAIVIYSTCADISSSEERSSFGVPPFPIIESQS